MISTITIKNFGLIDILDIDLSNRLNVFTGETGAGKTIIIDSLRFVLGEKINQSKIRDINKNCVVEAVFLFDTKSISKFPILDEYIDPDGTFIVSRTFTPEKRNIIKANGHNISVTQLKDIGDVLVDFHGPNDHQMLLNEASHLNILSGLSHIDKELETYSSSYKEYINLSEQLKKIHNASSTRDRDMDLYAHQIKELSQVTLKDDAYETVKQDFSRINNAEQLSTSIAAILDVFDNTEYGVNEGISKVFSPFEEISKIDESLKEISEDLISFQEQGAELANFIRDYADKLEYDPEEAQEITRKIDIYHDILKKYGPTLLDAENYYEEILKKYQFLENYSANTEDLRTLLNEKEKMLNFIASKMSVKRKTASAQLKTTIENELKDLGIKHVEFESRINKVSLKNTGFDEVVFYISPNAGEAMKPMQDIVSSGEAARIMLALKKAINLVDPVPVLIFDEIDSQIGGRLGSIIGNKLKELSEHHQVILITHLPQIASFGDKHLKVMKKVISGKTYTSCDELSKEDRINELAEMMGASEESKISKVHAKEMYERSQKQ
ncbi:MAG: DNA repair protein RecN [Candidatus Omnitrophica bacterium]|nr:DNA repair protein RecN [Candidatus Omnitrophota bacterium]